MNSLALKLAVPCATLLLVFSSTSLAGSKEEELLAAQHAKGKEAELLAGQHQKAQQEAAAAHAGKNEALLLAQQQQQQNDAAKAKASQNTATTNPAGQPNTTRDKASGSLKDVGLLPAR